MIDQYQKIIDKHYAEMLLKHQEIDRKYSRIIRNLILTLLIILAVITYFYYVCLT